MSLPLNLNRLTIPKYRPWAGRTRTFRLRTCIKPRVSADNNRPEPVPESSIDDSKDFWEGDQWDGLGQIASLALPVLIALGIATGIFAASQYNDGASVFLESASPETSAQYITLGE